MIEIVQFTLGPVETNSYLVADNESNEAVVIDPAWDGLTISRAASERGFKIRQVWLTHAHFDHLGGLAELVNSLQPPPPVALHSQDLPLWEMRGGADLFGIRVEKGPRPTILLEKENLVRVGSTGFEVRHAPGHTPGHVIFYSPQIGAAFCGDVIFAGAIGRTDLPGGNFQQLMLSIQNQILSLPEETRLLSGHGPETTVGEERHSNPFLTELDF
jgi:glyoxylase-like metal-dependent hydrolase (beta-lactamase superfamily II)